MECKRKSSQKCLIPIYDHVKPSNQYVYKLTYLFGYMLEILAKDKINEVLINTSHWEIWKEKGNR